MIEVIGIAVMLIVAGAGVAIGEVLANWMWPRG
jgi:hypothetical protein